MINILLPMAGSSAMFDSQQYPYPLPLTEICGRPMIEHVVANLSSIEHDVRFIFIMKHDDCKRFYLDHAVSLLAPERCKIVVLDGDTTGALCSTLMAITHINNEDPLIITNFDQIIDDIDALFSKLKSSECDAGCLTFNSVHPRWSYVRIEDEHVIEASEKKPISKHAIAGFYYFAQGKLFIEAAMRTILNQNSINDQYYISLTFNELILEGKSIKSVTVPSSDYHSFYTPQRIEEYESLMAKE